MEFDYFYKRNDFYFGLQASPAMIKYISKYKVLPCKVVDIGAGEGRNSFFLAKYGFDVTAIEPSELGVKKMLLYAQKERIQITIKKDNFLDGMHNIYDVDFFIASTVLDQMETDDLKMAILEINNKLNIHGYVFATVFTEDDPGFLKQKDCDISECGITVKHYFKKNELKNLFVNYDILEYEEKRFRDCSHGKPHYHNIAIIFARKKSEE